MGHHGHIRLCMEHYAALWGELFTAQFYNWHKLMKAFLYSFFFSRLETSQWKEEHGGILHRTSQINTWRNGSLCLKMMPAKSIAVCWMEDWRLVRLKKHSIAFCTWSIVLKCLPCVAGKWLADGLLLQLLDGSATEHMARLLHSQHMGFALPVKSTWVSGEIQKLWSYWVQQTWIAASPFYWCPYCCWPLSRQMMRMEMRRL